MGGILLYIVCVLSLLIVFSLVLYRRYRGTTKELIYNNLMKSAETLRVSNIAKSISDAAAREKAKRLSELKQRYEDSERRLNALAAAEIERKRVFEESERARVESDAKARKDFIALKGLHDRDTIMQGVQLLKSQESVKREAELARKEAELQRQRVIQESLEQARLKSEYESLLAAESLAKSEAERVRVQEAQRMKSLLSATRNIPLLLLGGTDLITRVYKPKDISAIQGDGLKIENGSYLFESGQSGSSGQSGTVQIDYTSTKEFSVSVDSTPAVSVDGHYFVRDLPPGQHILTLTGKGVIKSLSVKC